MEIEEGMSKVGVIVFRDISKYKQTVQKNAQLAAIVESTDDTITSSNLDGTILSWNNAATRMFGYSTEEAIGQSDLTIVAEDRVEKETAVVKELTAESECTERYETIRQAKDGSLIPVSLTVSPMRDEGGKIIGTSKITRDITESKKAEYTQLALSDELKRSNTELEQFASVVSHDLQEPLRGVAGCLQIIEEIYKGKGDEKVDKLIRHAVDGALRMHLLIEDLLSLSRVTTKEITIQPTDLSILLDRALDNLELTIKESQAIITRDPLPKLAVDGIQLVQLFQNLISNAIKFRSIEPLKIHVGAKRENGHWLFFVRDNGIGFKQEFTDRIFLPFNRLHTRDKYPGTGIGLAICQRIVERHKGNIWAESEEGKGATFYFTISVPKINYV
jgi:PAS domain S-box-containing protein